MVKVLVLVGLKQQTLSKNIDAIFWVIPNKRHL